MIESPRPNGLRGRVRPGPRWVKRSAGTLEVLRLAHGADRAAALFPEGSAPETLVRSAAEALRQAAESDPEA